MRIHSRKSWVATNPKETPIRIGGAVSLTYIHHTGDSIHEDAPPDEEKQRMRDIQHYHQSYKGWNDIAYSFVIFPSGRVYEGRGWGIVGAHTEGQNSVSHGICFVGNFETEQPTMAAIDAGRRLIHRGKERAFIRSRGFVRGHRDAPGAATACPGDHLYEKLSRIRKGATQ